MNRLRKVRQSQTIIPFGVGGMFDVLGESFVACDIAFWKNRGERLRSPRLEQQLGVTHFRAAPAHHDRTAGPAQAGVPYWRFPEWLFCPRCRAMTRWRRGLEVTGQEPACGRCPGRQQLVPMRFVQICSAGHLGDVPWPRWAHRGHGTEEQRLCSSEHLEFVTDRRGGAGLESLRVRCATCDSSQNLIGLTAPRALRVVGWRCVSRQPWQRNVPVGTCEEEPLVVQRGASNVYFPVLHSAIEIPPGSNYDAYSDLALDIQQHAYFEVLLMGNGPMAQMALDSLREEFGVSEEYLRGLVQDELNNRRGMGTVVSALSGDLLAEEWAAFLTPREDQDERDSFLTRHTTVIARDEESPEPHRLLAERIDRVVLADKLREVRALQGFRRNEPSARMVRVDLDRRLDWLPAVEVFGEGVFLSLDEARVSAWEERPAVRERIRELHRRVGTSFMADHIRERTGPVLKPRVVLLHTLAHLLIRRLSFESGYSAASLRERLYARVPGEGQSESAHQSGVLVYTAAGDAEGTLGGLVRQGEPPRLAATVLDLLEDALWCSADPLCREHRGQGFGSLNLAACHACCLVPETSCEHQNLLLDRVLLIGDKEVPGFFTPIVHSAEDVLSVQASSP